MRNSHARKIVPSGMNQKNATLSSTSLAQGLRHQIGCASGEARQKTTAVHIALRRQQKFSGRPWWVPTSYC